MHSRHGLGLSCVCTQSWLIVSTCASVKHLCTERQVIKRFIMHAKKTAFIVEHDFIMAAYLADRVIVYEGQPSVKAVARKPQSLVTGAVTRRICLSRIQ